MTQESHDAVALPLDRAVVAELVESHREFLRFVERRVDSRAAAEEIVQDAFARGLDKLDGLEHAGSARAWFYRVLRNAVIDHHRRRAAREGRESELPEIELHADAAGGAEWDRTICACIARLADTLKPEYANALRRVELDGVAVKDYANEAGISASNAGVRLFRARDALRERVRRSCGTCAEHGCLDCSCGQPTGTAQHD